MDSSSRPRPRARVTSKTRELRFDAGSLSLDLVATVGRRPVSPVERLNDTERLCAWCAGVGVALRADEDLAALLVALHRLRAAAHDVAVAVLEGRGPLPESVDLVNRRARIQPPAPRLRIGSDRVHAVESAEPVSGAVLQSLVARDLITTVTDPALRARLCACASETCRMIYLDAARGRTRKWCSMRRCGNSAKAALHRQRQETARRPDDGDDRLGPPSS